MKIIIALTLVLVSCNTEDKLLKETNALIKAEKEKFTKDSLEIVWKYEIEAARIRLEHATGKKDTLTNEEWLKKGEEEFK